MQWIRQQRGRFTRWFPTAHPGAQIGVLIGVLVVLPIFICCSGGVIFSASPLGRQIVANGEATSTAQAVDNAQATQQARVYAMTHPNPTATTTATTVPAATPASTATDAPTSMPAPTATPRPAPTATPRPAPTATPKPKCDTSGAPPNPWCFTFRYTGKLIYRPPSAFCSYFNCIPSFWKNTNGYVEECADGKYSHSGGRSGSCSYHGGNWRPLYQP